MANLNEELFSLWRWCENEADKLASSEAHQRSAVLSEVTGLRRAGAKIKNRLLELGVSRAAFLLPDV